MAQKLEMRCLCADDDTLCENYALSNTIYCDKHRNCKKSHYVYGKTTAREVSDYLSSLIEEKKISLKKLEKIVDKSVPSDDDGWDEKGNWDDEPISKKKVPSPKKTEMYHDDCVICGESMKVKEYADKRNAVKLLCCGQVICANCYNRQESVYKEKYKIYSNPALKKAFGSRPEFEGWLSEKDTKELLAHSKNPTKCPICNRFGATIKYL